MCLIALRFSPSSAEFGYSPRPARDVEGCRRLSWGESVTTIYCRREKAANESLCLVLAIVDNSTGQFCLSELSKGTWMRSDRDG
jgi:hypothetical protein